ncbi:MAG: very short patch repair endonuclease [Syntrophus sp. (in: bacteria)]|nr:very short patch repair endonuclease [Syntrophus sp. (in: bacteria)]
MADVHSKETRSYNMSRIKGKDTKPEILVRKYLFSKGLRYRLHQRGLAGTPDLVFRKYETVVFIHGCFWHGHKGCKFFVPPKTRTEWWLNKISTTEGKDVENTLKLKKQGWKVISVWECSLKSDKRYKTLAWLEDKIRNGR